MAVVEAVVVLPEVVVEVPVVVRPVEATASTSSDSKSLWKVSSLLFPRRIPFGFRLKGLENLDFEPDLEDNDEDDEDVVDEDSFESAKRWVWNWKLKVCLLLCYETQRYQCGQNFFGQNPHFSPEKFLLAFVWNMWPWQVENSDSEI